MTQRLTSKRRHGTRVALTPPLIVAVCHAGTPDVHYDENDFLFALGGAQTTLDFDHQTHGDRVSDANGVRFCHTGMIYNTVKFPGDAECETCPSALINAYPPDPTHLHFDPPVMAVGFWNTSIQDREMVTFHDSGEQVIHQDELPEGSMTFLGIISPAAIARVVIEPIAPTDGAIYIDTLHYAMPVGSVCEGDADGNGMVDVNDITFVVPRLGTSECPSPADVDRNSAVDVNDITFMIPRLGNNCP